MRHFPTRALVLIALAAQLGACNSFLGIKFARHAPRPVPEAATEPVTAVNAESATAVGRRQLTAGQTGLAIESFQRAMASGEPMAPAVNGLGVAYARLDRFDLAQRYFLQATASDPANTQYADNLARLMRSPALAMRRDGDIAAAALKAAVSPQASATAGRAASAASAVGKLQRISRGEVRIASAPAQAAPTATGQAKADRRFQPLVRVSIAERKAPRPASSVRAGLSQPTEAGAASETGEAGRRR